MSEIVNHDFTMNPETEKKIANGTELRDGMRVLIAAGNSLWRLEDSSPRDQSAILEINRWCNVSGIQERGTMVGFTATYDDGVQVARWYHKTLPWYVKLDSIRK